MMHSLTIITTIFILVIHRCHYKLWAELSLIWSWKCVKIEMHRTKFSTGRILVTSTGVSIGLRDGSDVTDDRLWLGQLIGPGADQKTLREGLERC